jgi:diacylglycerol kinase (ATP)
VTTPAPPVRVIWNANAGRRKLSLGQLDEAGVKALFDGLGLPVDVCASESAEDATRLTNEAVKAGVPAVVAAGGDGTVGVIAKALLETDVALGILPLGTVMNIVRMLNLPREPEAAAAVIAAGATRVIDVGEANGTTFFETTSVGMSAAIFRESKRFEEGDYGTLARAVLNAFRYRPARMRIELDHERTIHTRALMVTVGNGPYMGLGMTVAPGAQLDDGRFDVRVFRHFSKFELLRHLGSIAFGRRQYSPHVLSERSKVVRIHGSRPLPIRADARPLGMTPLECRVRPAALRVIVPSAAPDAGGAPRDLPVD